MQVKKRIKHCIDNAIKIVIAEISGLSEILIIFVTANDLGRDAIHISWHLIVVIFSIQTWRF